MAKNSIMASGLGNNRLTQCQRIAVLIHGKWWSPYELQREIKTLTGSWYSDATVTARIRDLRKKPFGAWDVVKRRLNLGDGRVRFEYMISKRKKGA